ncbi:hypothetical protein GCM10027415_17840 [Humibacter ginsengisoli]
MTVFALAERPEDARAEPLRAEGDRVDDERDPLDRDPAPSVLAATLFTPFDVLALLVKPIRRDRHGWHIIPAGQVPRASRAAASTYGGHPRPPPRP